MDPNRVSVVPFTLGLSVQFSTTSITAVLVTGSTTLISNVLAGDIVCVDFVADVSSNNAGGYVSVQAGFSENLAGYVADGTSFATGWPGGTGTATAVGTCAHVVATSGTLGIGLMAQSNALVNTAYVQQAAGLGNTTIRAFIVRP